MKRDRVISRLPTGYMNGAPDAVAQEAGALINGWAQMMHERPLINLEHEVEELAPQASAYAWGADDADSG